MKKCSHCKQIKQHSEFHRNKSRKDGYASTCIECYQSQNFYKTLNCTECNVEFTVKHRNIKKRKYFLCEKCIQKLLGITRRKEGDTIIDHGYARIKTKKSEKSPFLHRRIMEEFLKRPLVDGEVVHHIDGNKLNNEIDNLWLTNHSFHTKAHHSLEKIGIHLYRQGLVKFDYVTGEYILMLNKP